MDQQDEARIIRRDVTAACVRAWQYRAWRQFGEVHTHSLNLVALHRDHVSHGHTYLFEGRSVMGEGA